VNDELLGATPGDPGDDDIIGAAEGSVRTRVLVADDDRVMRRVLAHVLETDGFRVTAVESGEAAQKVLAGDDPPPLVVLDWMMPGLSGPEVCRWIRSQPTLRHSYVVLVTAHDSVEAIVEGLDAGADDFVPKPFRGEELLARVRSGHRVCALQMSLQAKVHELEAALAEVHQLRGLIPICMHCHRIRSDSAHWQKLEGYIEAHSTATFSHSVCDECLAKHYPDDATNEPVPAEAPRNAA